MTISSHPKKYHKAICSSFKVKCLVGRCVGLFQQAYKEFRYLNEHHSHSKTNAIIEIPFWDTPTDSDFLHVPNLSS